MKQSRLFTWTGIDSEGKKCEGKDHAINRKILTQTLRNNGIFTLNIKSDFKFRIRQNKITKKTIITVLKQLTLLIQSEIPLTHALLLVSNGFSGHPFQCTIIEIKKHVESGHSLSNSMAYFPHLFNPLMISFVRTGEKTGHLSELLLHLSTHFDRELELQRKYKKALFYPCVILVTAFLITSALFWFVIPQFQNLFNEFGTELPYATRLVIHAANLLRHIGFPALSIGFGLLTLWKYYPVKQEKLSYFIDRFLLRIPFLSSIIQEKTTTTWLQLLAMTQTAAIPLTEALMLAAASISNRVLKAKLSSLPEKLTAGHSLHHAMQGTHLFSNQTLAFIAIGESAGSLDQMLMKISLIRQMHLFDKLDRLSQLLEPAIMLLLALFTGGLILSMYLPIFRIGAAL